MTLTLCSRAPARIDLAGGWTDVPPFATHEGGAVLSVAIDRYTHATVRALPGSAVRLRSQDFDRVVEAPDPAALVYDGTLDLLKAAVRRHGAGGGFEVTTRSEVPPGSGLGTSASLGVAVVGLLARHEGGPVSPAEIAAAATALETDELGIAGGKQDQLAAALGGANFMEFGGGPPATSRASLSEPLLCELDRRLVLVYSGASRLSGDIVRQVQQAYERGDHATRDALRRMRALASALRDHLEAGRVDEVGAILLENWQCQLRLHPAVSTPEIHQLFEVALSAGAEGGKACGAGGGGCIVFFAADGAERSLRQALRDAGAAPVDFHLDQTGLRCWQVDPSSGHVS